MLVPSNIIVVQIWWMLADCGNYSLCFSFGFGENKCFPCTVESPFNTLRTGDADLRFYITTVQDG